MKLIDRAIKAIDNHSTAIAFVMGFCFTAAFGDVHTFKYVILCWSIWSLISLVLILPMTWLVLTCLESQGED